MVQKQSNTVMWKGMVDDSPNWEFSRNDLMECIPDDWMLIDLDNDEILF